MSNVLGIVKGILNIIHIIVPIILLLSLTITIVKLISSPDDDKKTYSKIKNTVIATIAVFFIPMLIDLSMGMIGNNTHISSCWINASTPSFSSHFIKLTDKDNKSFIGNPQDYEKGDEKNPGAVTANSISNKTDYANKKLNVVKAITTNNNNPSSGLGDGRNKYRAVQAACYTGKYAVYAQNKNYGSIDSSSKGGRVCWSEMATDRLEGCVELGGEAGHMDGLAYDNDRGYILKTSSENGLILIDNATRKIAGYSKISSIHVGITYVPSIHMLVGYDGGKLHFYQYNQSNNTYEKRKEVTLQNWNGDSIQGIGTDGTNIFIADSSPYNSYRALYTYSLNGIKLEQHSFGSGFGSMSDEVEAPFADNNGNLYLACPQGIGRVTNYKANIIGFNV